MCGNTAYPLTIPYTLCVDHRSHPLNTTKPSRPPHSLALRPTPNASCVCALCGHSRARQLGNFVRKVFRDEFCVCRQFPVGRSVGRLAGWFCSRIICLTGKRATVLLDNIHLRNLTLNKIIFKKTTTTSHSY